MHFRPFAATAAAIALTLVTVSSAFSQSKFSARQFAQTNLVGDTAGNAAVTDPNLRNPWGLSRSSNGDWWVSDAATGLSTLYSGTTGAITPLVVAIPPSDPTISKTGLPSGTVFNGTGGFLVSGKPAVFLFATLDGTISGWNPAVNLNNAIITVNEKSGSSYTGLTMAQTGIRNVPTNYLYASDFAKGRIAVFDTNFKHVDAIEKKFNSIQLPKGYAPFNIQNLGGNLYMTIAQVGPDGAEVHGDGLGEVAVISPEGQLLQVFEPGKYFNAPWGLVLAPSDFGAYSHDVLVGNFGSGKIVAFDPVTGKYRGMVENSVKAPLVIPGLWALSVGNNTELGGPATSVFFSAGPNDEQDGLFGALTSLSNPYGNDQ